MHLRLYLHCLILSSEGGLLSPYTLPTREIRRVHPKSGTRDVRKGFRAGVGWVVGRGGRASPKRLHGTRTRRLDSAVAERGCMAVDSTAARMEAYGLFGRVEGLIAGHFACACRNQGRSQSWRQSPCRESRTCRQECGRFCPELAQERRIVSQSGCEFLGSQVSAGHRQGIECAVLTSLGLF